LREYAKHAFSKVLQVKFQLEGLSLRALSFPDEDSQSPLEIASGANEEVL
jgi:hypothetical protein